MGSPLVWCSLVSCQSIHLHTYIHTYKHAYIHLCARVCTHVFGHMSAHIHAMYMDLHKCRCVHIMYCVGRYKWACVYECKHPCGVMCMHRQGANGNPCSNASHSAATHALHSTRSVSNHVWGSSIYTLVWISLRIKNVRACIGTLCEVFEHGLPFAPCL